jgi:hypothetical protein
MNSDAPLNIHPFHSERENVILQWAFKFKGALAGRKAWHLKGCVED